MKSILSSSGFPAVIVWKWFPEEVTGRKQTGGEGRKPGGLA